MDHASFAALARRLNFERTRRSILGGAAGGLAALVGLGGRQDGRAARCTKSTPCPACFRCRNHRCKPQYDGAACDGGTCVNGVCGPVKFTTRATAA